MLTELNVVNACLATLGENPLVELEEDHPLVAAARQNFRESMVTEMGRKWWFNTDYLELQQANDKFIYIPQDAISCVPIERDDLTVRGRRLYNRYAGTYEVRGPVLVYVVRDLEFSELPVPAQLLVRDRTVLSFQLNYDADETRTSKLEQAYVNSYMTLNAENIRQQNVNMLNMPGATRLRHRAGYRQPNRVNWRF